MEYCKWLKQKESCWKPKELLPGKTQKSITCHFCGIPGGSLGSQSILSWSQLLRHWQWKVLVSAASKRPCSESRSFLWEGWVLSSHSTPWTEAAIEGTLVTRLLKSSFGNGAKGWLNTTDKLLSWLCPYHNQPQPLPRRIALSTEGDTLCSNRKWNYY